MAGNTFGTVFRLTTFGESHGTAIGGVIDGCPAGVVISTKFIQGFLDRRKAGQSGTASPRQESDLIEIISGIFENKTTGAPIAFLIKNKDHRPEDYEQLKNAFRPSHADFSWNIKYGIRDYRGGGRSSARETAIRVAAGAVAMHVLKQAGIEITAWVSAIGTVSISKSLTDISPSDIYSNEVRCPDPNAAVQMIEYLEELKTRGDTAGGIINCIIKNAPAGLGEPVFDKLQADLAKAMLSINAVKGFEYGSGFSGSAMKGSEHNDIPEGIYINEAGSAFLKTMTNYSGGIQGGITNGQDIYFRVAFKPVSTLMKDQQTIDNTGQPIILKSRGRHDVCVVPRAVPIVEAMTALVLCDHFLRAKLSRV